MIVNKAFIYKSIPNGWPIPGQDLAIEDIGFDEDADPPKNGFSTKNLFASFDPSQRGRMRDPKLEYFTAAMKTGEPVISASVIGKVLKSRNQKFEKGAIVVMSEHFIESYSTVSELAVEQVQIIEPQQGVPLTAYIGVLGMSGMTAYGLLREIGRPKTGEVILVSAAAGAVGQMVGQLARLHGLQVIGSVGSDEKLNFIINKLGFTSGFNYKTESICEAVKRLAPNGIDIYWDNVGGELLDVAIDNMKYFGRIVACGSISATNRDISQEQHGLKNYRQVGYKRLTWKGAVVVDPEITQWTEERDANITKWLRDGSFKSVDHVTDGIDNAITGFLGMLKGENIGKSVLKIADPE